MAKEDNTKPDAPKKEEKKGFFSRVGRDIKNLAVGIASLPAHFATNPVDMGGKTALIAASAIPVFGSIVAGVYAFKQSMRGEKLGVGSVLKSVAKAVVVGAAAAIPGVGPAIMTAYVATNIGEQVEQTVKASKLAGVPKTTLEAIKDKYKEAGENVKSLGNQEKRAEIGQKIKSFASVEGVKEAVKAVRDNIGPLTSKGVEENVQKLAEKIKQEKSQPLVPELSTVEPSVPKPSTAKPAISNPIKRLVSNMRDKLTAKQNQKGAEPNTTVAKTTPKPKSRSSSHSL